VIEVHAGAACRPANLARHAAPPGRKTVDYRTLFAEISRRPGLYGLDGSFEQFAAFVSGVDAGNDWQLLTGFREWLIVRLGDGNNLAWSGLVLRLAFPDGWPGLRDRLKDPEQNRVASETLFQLLDEFLARRAAHDEPAAIFDEYLTWRRAQSWHKPTGTQSSPPAAAS
jgi:hypothetical protein